MVSAAGSGYNFVECLYFPNPTTLLLTPTEDPQLVVKHLKLCRTAIRQDQASRVLSRIETLAELSGAFAKSLEQTASGTTWGAIRSKIGHGTEKEMTTFHQELQELVKSRRAELLEAMRRANNFSGIETKAENSEKVKAMAVLLTQAGVSLKEDEVFKGAKLSFARATARLLNQCALSEISEILRDVLEADPELSFLEAFVRTGPQNERLSQINGCLTAEDRAPTLQSPEVRFNVHMFQYSRLLWIANSSGEDLTEQAIFEKTISLANIVTLLASTPLSERELKFAMLYLNEASAKAMLPVHFLHVEAIMQQLLRHERAYSWLDHYVEAAPTDKSLTCCLQALLKLAPREGKSSRVLKRYRQLALVDERIRNLTSCQMFYIAHLIETKFIFMEYETRHEKKSGQIARSITRDQQRGDLLIKTKSRELPEDMKKNDYKKFTRIIVLPQDSMKPARLAYQWVNRDPPKDVPPKKRESYMRDAIIHRRLSGLPGIWKVIALREYEKIPPSNQTGARAIVSRISLTTEEADGTLLHAFLGEIKLEQWQMISLFEQIAAILWHMHSVLGQMHGDLKPKNIVLKRHPDGSIEVGLIDFENSWSIKKGERCSFTFTTYGTYGTKAFTAPEVVGAMNFQGDFYKTEVFALGLIFYEWLEDQQTDWVQEILSLNPSSPTTMDDRALVWQSIKSHVEKPYEQLAKKQGLTFREKFRLLILSMLRLYPEDRFSMKEVVENLAKLKKEFASIAPRAPDEHKAAAGSSLQMMPIE